MLLNILKIPFILLEVLVTFNLIIIVHELGHFLAAKWRGLVIEKFGIWFGKPIWKKTIGGVEYSFGTIPFGGFVALPQMAPMDIIEGKSEARAAAAPAAQTHKTVVEVDDMWVVENAEGPATPRPPLPPVSALDKIIVAFAGPLFSFLLAIVFATLVWMVGRPVTESEATTTIGYVEPDSPAAAAGLQAGDVITEVDGQPVHRFSGMGSDNVTWRIIRSEGDTVPVTVERTVNGVKTTLTLNPKPEIEATKPWMRKALREIGILPAQQPMVAEVQPASPAAKAGLMPSDLILAIDGQPAYTLEFMADYVKTHPMPSHILDIERAGKRVQIPFTPLGATVNDVLPDSPASAGGVQAGDVITAVDDKSMPDGLAISDYIRAHGNLPVRFTIQRTDLTGKSQTVTTTITPEIPVGDTMPHIGLEWADEFGIVEDTYGKFQVQHPTPVDQVQSGVMTIFDTIGALASKKSDIKLQHMGGPLMMMRLYYMFFENREGWRLALWFSVVLNVNLAILNLLPIPVLDGGHITLALIEAVRRRPVNLQLIEVVQTSCAVVIIGFMLYIAFFDAQNYFNVGNTQMRFEPKDTATGQSH
jgi:regulator of sigma E protease